MQKKKKKKKRLHRRWWTSHTDEMRAIFLSGLKNIQDINNDDLKNEKEIW